MSFWPGEKLATELPGLIDPYDRKHIDCAAYELGVGHEIYVTADPNAGGVKDGLTTHLGEGEKFKIPPGQFAFLLTEESVKVPETAIAFISFKTSIKFRGLVNVSGFHVDPGWSGHLMFSVYNAGPNPVYVTRGQPLFLIWYANLERCTEMTYKGDKGANRIDVKYLDGMTGQVFSPMVLDREVRSIRERQVEGLSALDKKIDSEFRKSSEAINAELRKTHDTANSEFRKSNDFLNAEIRKVNDSLGELKSNYDVLKHLYWRVLIPVVAAIIIALLPYFLGPVINGWGALIKGELWGSGPTPISTSNAHTHGANRTANDSTNAENSIEKAANPQPTTGTPRDAPANVDEKPDPTTPTR